MYLSYAPVVTFIAWPCQLMCHMNANAWLPYTNTGNTLLFFYLVCNMGGGYEVERFVHAESQGVKG